jgi:hypothetical protein
MLLAGHSFAQVLQPTHFSASTFATVPLSIAIAFKGQTFAQQPQATHSLLATTANLFFFTFL